MALQWFSASSSSCGSGSSSDSASSTRSASASEDDEPPAKKAKGLEDPDSMRNLSWNQLQSMDAEDPSILSNNVHHYMFFLDGILLSYFICRSSCWKISKEALTPRYYVDLLPAEWKISRTCCTSSETTLLQKEVQSRAFVQNSSGLGSCILVIDKNCTGFFATWPCFILDLVCRELSCLDLCKTWMTTWPCLEAMEPTEPFHDIR